MTCEGIVSWFRRLRWEHRWRNDRYRTPWLTENPRAFVAAGFAAGWLVPGMKALEIGCGRGHTAAWLASGGLDVVAIDFSRHAIQRARRLFGNQPHLTFEVVDACGANTLTATFDLLIDTGCLQGIPERLHQRYRRNILAWSRPGSRYVVPMHCWRSSFHEKIEQVRSLFCPPFELEHFEETPSSMGGPPKPVIHLVRRDAPDP